MDLKRRRMLQLGAAGMPMMFTLRASASPLVISQLQCLITIPESWVILVDDQGGAWMGDMSWKENNKLTKKRIEALKEGADFVFPSGSVPDEYLPDGECETSDDDKDCGWGNDSDDPMGDNDDQGSCEADPNRETPWFEEDDKGDGSPGNSGNNKKPKGGNDDDDDDVSCQYKVYLTGSIDAFPISDYVDEGGNWNVSGTEGLYITLASQYAGQFGDTEGFPGVSCLLSVLNYLGNN